MALRASRIFISNTLNPWSHFEGKYFCIWQVCSFSFLWEGNRLQILMIPDRHTLPTILLCWLGEVEVKSLSRVRLCDPMDCNLLGFSIHGILQARILEWIAVSFSKGSSQPRDQTRVSCIGGRLFNLWATREAQLLLLLGASIHSFIWQAFIDHLLYIRHCARCWNDTSGQNGHVPTEQTT